MVTTAPPSLQQVLKQAQLSALPQSAIKLLELSRDEENGPPEYAVPIEADPGLAAQVLKFVNSSYFGFSREISSVRQAITLVGVRTIKNFALWSAVFSLMPNPRCGPFQLKQLWQDSLRRGLFARVVGKAMKLGETEDLFAAGLLQDMAIPLLAKALGDVYAAVLTRRDDEQRRLSELERDQFGWTHAKAAGMMARAWSLPENFATLIESHTKLGKWISGGEKPDGKLVISLSAMLPAAHDGLWHERGQFDAGYNLLHRRGLPPAVDVLAGVDVLFEDFAPVLNLATPDVSLVERYC